MSKRHLDTNHLISLLLTAIGILLFVFIPYGLGLLLYLFLPLDPVSPSSIDLWLWGIISLLVLTLVGIFIYLLVSGITVVIVSLINYIYPKELR